MEQAVRRSTKQREVILGIVRESHSHPTADDVYGKAKAAIPALSLGTVYRNLRLLTKEGSIKEVHLAGSPSRFDGMTGEHEHFICTGCGTITDIEPTIGSKLGANLASTLPEAIVTSYSLNYYGVCKKCRPEDIV